MIKTDVSDNTLKMEMKKISMNNSIFADLY